MTFSINIFFCVCVCVCVAIRLRIWNQIQSLGIENQIFSHFL